MCGATSPLTRTSGVDPVRRTPSLCGLSGLPVVDLTLVLGGAEVVQRGVQPPPVVEDLDELEHGSADLSPRGPRLAVDELELEGCEPALGHRVVPALTGPGEALGDLVGVQELTELARGVLSSPPSKCTRAPSPAGSPTPPARRPSSPSCRTWSRRRLAWNSTASSTTSRPRDTPRRGVPRPPREQPRLPAQPQRLLRAGLTEVHAAHRNAVRSHASRVVSNGRLSDAAQTR